MGMTVPLLSSDMAGSSGVFVRRSSEERRHYSWHFPSTFAVTIIKVSWHFPSTFAVTIIKVSWHFPSTFAVTIIKVPGGLRHVRRRHGRFRPRHPQAAHGWVAWR